MMKTHKFLINGFIITAIAVAYVHQHIEIYKAGYEVHKSRMRLSYLVDRNCNLTYDLSKLESPRYLLAAIGDKEMEFARKGRRRVARYEIARVSDPPDRPEANFVEKIMDAVIPKAEARPHARKRP